MVTFGEFVQHVVTAGWFRAVALVVLVVFVHRYDDGHDFLRKAFLGFLGCLGLIVVLSLTATVTESRCQRDPSEFCRYNDNIPFMAMVVFIFLVLVLGRAWMAYLYRPLTKNMFETPPRHTRRQDRQEER